MATRIESKQFDDGSAKRLSLKISPNSDSSLTDQISETLSQLKELTKDFELTMINVFLKEKSDLTLVRQRIQDHFSAQVPACTYLLQPPCEGQALTIEVWAIAGYGVKVSYFNDKFVTAEYDGLKWIYLAGINAPDELESAYQETETVFAEISAKLKAAGASFSDVTRIWLYQPAITEIEKNSKDIEQERYRQLNRRRTEIFDNWEDSGEMTKALNGKIFYPPSTGIGMTGQSGLTASCIALQTSRDDVKLVPLENPQQTSAFDYERKFSVKSPKFSRAMALLNPYSTSVWISGTASIIDAESVHIGDIEKQTEQTLDNIELLINPKNLAKHGHEGAGASLTELRRARVYIKNQADIEKCKEVCKRRLGDIPTTYVLADVCRPELLVEIEGFAYSRR